MVGDSNTFTTLYNHQHHVHTKLSHYPCKTPHLIDNNSPASQTLIVFPTNLSILGISCKGNKQILAPLHEAGFT